MTTTETYIILDSHGARKGTVKAWSYTSALDIYLGAYKDMMIRDSFTAVKKSNIEIFNQNIKKLQS